MIYIIIILVYLLTSLVLYLIRLRRANFPYLWLISTVVTLVTWLVVLFSPRLIQGVFPVIIPLIMWQPDILFPISPTLILDDISWLFSISLTTLTLTAVLTDIGRRKKESENNAPGWPAILALTAFSLLAVLSANLLTILLAWAAIDLAELVIWLPRQTLYSDHISTRRVFVNYSVHSAGILVVIAAGMIASASGSSMGFIIPNPQISILLVLACGLRLGVLPPSIPIPETTSQDGLDVLLRLAPATASLALLPRLDLVGTSSTLIKLASVLALLALIYGSITWFSARSAQQASAHWIMSVAALAVIAILLGVPAASLGWSISLLMVGGVIFLYHSHHRRIRLLLIITSAGLLMLPYTQTWFGLQLFGTQPSAVSLIVLFFQSLVVTGFILHSLNLEPPLIEAERWVWLIYPLGLTILVITFLGVGFWSTQASRTINSTFPSLVGHWPSLVSGILVFLLVFLRRRGRLLPVQIATRLTTSTQRILSYEWLFKLVQWIYSSVQFLSSGLSQLLEGQAGILWTLLVLVLILSLITQVKFGG